MTTPELFVLFLNDLVYLWAINLCSCLPKLNFIHNLFDFKFMIDLTSRKQEKRPQNWIK